MRKIVQIILIFAMIVSLASVSVLAVNQTDNAMDAANALYDLGLFKGTGVDGNGNPVFELDRKPTRIEALVMMLRLFGEEDAALAYTGSSPFSDVPAWAESYVGYAYTMGYTKGVSSTKFGAQDAANENSFVTFVLRALGYSDTKGDFSYNTATDYAVDNGIISEYLRGKTNFTRGDCAVVSNYALNANCKGTDTTLLDKLVEEGKVSKGTNNSSEDTSSNEGSFAYGQDYFSTTQSGNYPNGNSIIASDGKNVFIIENVADDSGNSSSLLYKLDSNLSNAKLVYKPQQDCGKLRDLAIHNGKLYFIDSGNRYDGDSPFKATSSYSYFMSMDIETGKTEIVYSNTITNASIYTLGWCNGVFYLQEYTSINGGAGYRVVSIDENNKVSFLPAPNTGFNSSTWFVDVAGWNGEIYVSYFGPNVNMYFAKWNPSTGDLETYFGCVDFQIVGDDIYYQGYDLGDDLSTYTLYHAKMNNLGKRDIVCTFSLPIEDIICSYGKLYVSLYDGSTHTCNTVCMVNKTTGKYTTVTCPDYIYKFSIYGEYILSNGHYQDYFVNTKTGAITSVHDFIR